MQWSIRSKKNKPQELVSVEKQLLLLMMMPNTLIFFCFSQTSCMLLMWLSVPSVWLSLLLLFLLLLLLLFIIISLLTAVFPCISVSCVDSLLDLVLRESRLMSYKDDLTGRKEEGKSDGRIKYNILFYKHSTQKDRERNQLSRKE